MYLYTKENIMTEDIRKMIDKVKNFKQFVNERNDLNVINKYNSIIDNIIDKHKKNLKYVLNTNISDLSDAKLKELIFSISNDNPRFKVFFSNMDSGGYSGEVIKINNVDTIYIYNKEYAEQLGSFYWSAMENKNKRKYFKGISDLAQNNKIKSTILHELVHIHDKIKYDDTEKLNNKFTKLVNKNNNDFNSIHNNLYSTRTTEYNAYFLQRADSYLNKNGDLTNFNDFKEYMVNIPVYDNMNKDLKKKYLNRVYSFFQSFKK